MQRNPTASILSSFFASFIGLIFFAFFGAGLGANYFPEFTFFDMQGYEAMGALFALFGTCIVGFFVYALVGKFSLKKYFFGHIFLLLLCEFSFLVTLVQFDVENFYTLPLVPLLMNFLFFDVFRKEIV